MTLISGSHKMSKDATIKPGIVVDAFNASTQEVEAGGSL